MRIIENINTNGKISPSEARQIERLHNIGAVDDCEKSEVIKDILKASPRLQVRKKHGRFGQEIPCKADLTTGNIGPFYILRTHTFENRKMKRSLEYAPQGNGIYKVLSLDAVAFQFVNEEDALKMNDDIKALGIKDLVVELNKNEVVLNWRKCFSDGIYKCA